MYVVFFLILGRSLLVLTIIITVAKVRTKIGMINVCLIKIPLKFNLIDSAVMP